MKIYCSRADNILTKLCGKDLYVLIYNGRTNRQGWYKIIDVLDDSVVAYELCFNYVTNSGYFHSQVTLKFKDIIVYDEICTADEAEDYIKKGYSQ